MEGIMSTSAGNELRVEVGLESRLLQEGYGSGAWHGPDLKAALADVKPGLAFWRPAAGRHNIAEIALHHAYCTRAVRAKVSGQTAEPFVMAGEDWFEVSDEQTLSWSKIRATVDAEQQRFHELIARVESGSAASAVPDTERLGLVLGITCHAIYHAGQVQLIKRLHGE
jgi:DinB superfamily